MQVSPGSFDNSHAKASTSNGVSNHATKETAVDLLLHPESESYQAKDTEETIPQKVRYSAMAFWQSWSPALRHILPIYIALHLALLVVSCQAFLFTSHDFSLRILPFPTLWTQWHHWDTGYFMQIALHGYRTLDKMAFYPFYPLLERAGMFITQDPFTAGLIVSNIAELILFVVLYRLVEEDFDATQAYHSVLYLALFPAAFFLSAAYSESVFLCLSVLSFYNMRHRRWLLAGLFGFLAGLTRASGVLLVVPFCYEYLRQVWQQQETVPDSFLSREGITSLLRGLRPNILIIFCFPASLVLFAVYSFYQFHDPLAFVHAESIWGRTVGIPGLDMWQALLVMNNNGFLSFLTQRTMIDLGAGMFVVVLIVLMFLGPWKLPRSLWSYALYALTLCIYLHLFSPPGRYPLLSMARFSLEVFPVFIIFSRISKYRTLHLSYCMVSGALLFFLLTQFLLGHWVV